MNSPRERQRAQREATVEHRQREDAAPRLRDQVGRLLSLRFRFDDVRDPGRLLAVSYVRPIVVEAAPAHFEVRCMEARCSGRHDLTRAVMLSLRRSEHSFAGTSDCDGMVGDEPCDRMLAYTCEATYRADGASV